MPMLRTIDRPTKAILRPCSAAMSMICWIRCTCEANDATMIRPSARRKTASRTGTMSRSLATKPGTSAFVLSIIRTSTPASPTRAKPFRSVIRPSSGSWSILKSPVCRTVPAGVRMTSAIASGIEWFTARNSTSKGPSDWRSRSPTWIVPGEMRCSRIFDSTKARVSCEPRTGMSARSRSRYGQRADVVLVTVGEHHGLDVIEAVDDRPEVGQDQVDARLVLLREQHAAVDDQQSAVVLEDGHVATDLAEAAEGEDAQRPLRERRARAAASRGSCGEAANAAEREVGAQHVALRLRGVDQGQSHRVRPAGPASRGRPWSG